MEQMVKIEYSEFPTHVIKRARKTKPDLYTKVNNNSIYNSNVARFARNIVMDELHKYLMLGGDVVLRRFRIPYKKFFILQKFCVPRNYGSVQRRNGRITWKPVTDKYKGVWDVGNYGDIWNKAFEDSLQIAGVISGDDVSTVIGHGVEFFEVNDIKDRKIIFEIHNRE